MYVGVKMYLCVVSQDQKKKSRTKNLYHIFEYHYLKLAEKI
jgi:hypothetical protein